MNKKKIWKRILSGFMCAAIALSGVVNINYQTVNADVVTDVTSVSAGEYHTASLRSDRTVVCWGNNGNGELGDGTNNSSNTPVKVKDINGNILTGITAVSARGGYTVALKTDNTVWSWGLNGNGQLGDGTTTYRNEAVQVKNSSTGQALTDVTAVSAGGAHTVALKKDGTVWSWGWNCFGQLGDGTTTDSNKAVQVKDSSGQPLADITAVSAGGCHTIAVKKDGTVWSWGWNDWDQLGDGTTTDSNKAVQVKDSSGQALTDVIAVSAGGLHTVAMKKDGTVWSWGYNNFGQLGDGTTANKNKAVQVKDSSGQPLADITAVSAGESHTVVLKNDKTVWSWGYNNHGQLGDGTTASRNEAVQVKDSSGQPLADITTVSAGESHTVVLKNDKTVWSWGYNNYGQLGDGTTTDSSFPVKTQLLTNEEAVDTDKGALAIGYTGIDNSNSVTQNITLPTSGANGTSISWASDNAAITSAGLVIRPDYFDKNATVTLTATITKGTSKDTRTFSLTVIKNAITDQESVDTDKGALAIGYAGIDNANSVTQNIILLTSGSNGTSISWTSDNAAITSAGVVARPDYFTGNVTVTLTATITKGSITDTKIFSLTVIKNAITDQESVDTDKGALAIGYAGLDNSNSVTQNIALPTSGVNGTSIRWASNNAAITSTGAVTRPDYLTGDSTVTLTATITKGTSTETKAFNLIVIKSPATDEECVGLDKTALSIKYAQGDSANSVTQNIILPLSGANGTSISWTSDNAAIKSAGLVIRPDYFDKNAVVTLTATITKGNSTDTKAFNLTVIKNTITDQESVDTDKGALAIGYASGDNSNSITQNITLPTSGANGTNISWTSDNAAITSAGLVIRPDYFDKNATAALTATITKGTSTDTKTFSLTVIKNAITDQESVDTDKQVLAIDYAGLDNANSVTQNITLPTSGANGTSISWASDNAAITSAGLVIRPDYFTGDAAVTLMATITKGASTDTKTFKLTVIKSPATDQECVGLDKTSLSISYASGDNANSVMQNIILPLSGANGTSISWASDNAAITSAGLVIRPDYFDKNAVVTLTATVTKGTSADTKTFSLTVIKNTITDQESADTDKGALAIGYSNGDDSNSVTQNITLPTSGANGTSISWASDNAAISSTGVVTRPDSAKGDAKVTLTAEVTKGDAKAAIKYVVTVKAMPEAAATKSNTTALPITGSPLNFMTLEIIGLLLAIAGGVSIKRKKQKVTK